MRSNHLQMQKRKILLSIIFFVAIIAAGFWSYRLLSTQQDTRKKQPKQENTKFVSTNTVSYLNQPLTIVCDGRVTSGSSVNLTAEVQGRIIPTTTPLRPGETFKKGDLLVKLDATTAAHNLKAMKSDFYTALSSVLADISMDYPEHYEQWQQYFHKIDFEKPLPELPVPQSNQLKVFLSNKNIFKQYYSIEAEQSNLRKYSIYAPFDGSYSDVQTQEGAVVGPGSTIATMINNAELELELPLDRKEIQLINKGDRVSIYQENDTITGAVKRIAHFVESTTQSVNVYATFSGISQYNVFPGTYMKADIHTKSKVSAMKVPRNIVLEENQIYTVEDNKLQLKHVNVLKKYAETLLFNGLEEGTLIVDEPLLNAVEGMKVKTNTP